MALSMRCSAASVWPSKRSTSTGVVLDERISPKAIRPVDAQAIDGVERGIRHRKSASATACATSAGGSPSAQATLSSGVEKLVGSASSIGLASGAPADDLQQAAAA
jgi:hypothetical protein